MTKHLCALAAILLIASGVVAGCQSIPVVASLAPSVGPLATVTVRGGECPQGACGGTTVIERDGRIHQSVPVAKELGQLPDDLLGALVAAVNTADFDVIRAKLFTGECPVAFDGQETIFEFGAPGGTQRIATCETEVDPNHPLFLATTAALQSVLAEQDWSRADWTPVAILAPRSRRPTRGPAGSTRPRTSRCTRAIRRRAAV